MKKPLPRTFSSSLRAKKTRRVLYLFLGISLLLTSLRLLSLADAPFPSVPDARTLSAAVGVSVNVEPNQYNTVARQLSEKEAALSERELALQELEKNMLATSQKGDRLFQYMLGISGVLMMLTLLNFFLDWRRTRTMRYGNA